MYWYIEQIPLHQPATLLIYAGHTNRDDRHVIYFASPQQSNKSGSMVYAGDRTD